MSGKAFRFMAEEVFLLYYGSVTCLAAGVSPMALPFSRVAWLVSSYP